MTLPQLPRLCDLMTPAVQALIAARPKAELHLAAGIYGDVLAGWEAQATIWRKYIAAECDAGRLPRSTGQALVELASSDFWSDRDRTPQAAVGSVQLVRLIVNADPSGVGVFPVGSIKLGHRFSVLADPTAKPPIQAAQFSSTEPVYVGADATETVPVDDDSGNYNHYQAITVPVIASTTGTQANTPNVFGENAPAGSSVDSLFDPTLTVSSILASGGSTGVDDPWERVIAASELAGFFGPNNAALVAGAMTIPRVRRVAIQNDPKYAIARVYIADTSWACSDQMRALVRQNIAENYLGWGCRFSVWTVYNRLVGVVGTVVLDSATSLTATAEITANVRKALREYFDERPDWYTFRLRSVRAVISRADPRIITCSQASVLDQNNSVVTEPPRVLDTGTGSATHFYLLDDAVRLTFAPAS